MVHRSSPQSGEAVDQLFRELETPLGREVMWHSYSRLSNSIARWRIRLNAPSMPPAVSRP